MSASTQPAKDLFNEIVSAFSADQVNVDDLPENDPATKSARACENLFTGGVEVLRSIVPNERIRALGGVVWDLVGDKRVLVAIGPDVPTLAFTCMQLRGVIQGIVLMPKAWPQMVEKDPFMQLGAILFVGVQVIDFYNDRLIGDSGARVRWQAYEAELLKTLQETLPTWMPNEYQRQLLAKYPRGIDSPGVDLYAYQPYRAAQETA